MKKNEFKSELESDKIKIKHKVKNWTEADYTEHYRKLERIYASTGSNDVLGDFSWDTEYSYHWHTYEGSPRKLPDRLSVGWSFASIEDARASQLTDTYIKEHSVDGQSCVEMSHGNCKAVLLKIPKELEKINRIAREKLYKKESLFDHDNVPIKIKQSFTDKAVTNVIDGGVLSVDDN